MKVDKRLFQALAQFWNPAYSCFTFGNVDLVPTIKEFMTLLQCSKILVDKIYSKADLNLTHPDARKKVDVFALSIYGLVMFPKTLGHVDEAVTDLFDRLEKRVTPVPAMLAETFRSLNACRRAREVFSESYSPLKEIVATPRRDDIFEEKWMVIFKIYRRKISSGELRGCFQMRCNTGQGSLYLQLRDWPSLNSRIEAMVTKGEFVRWSVHEVRLIE
ncbi:hypothetical protein Gotur_004121 [Gossypium turneri]